MKNPLFLILILFFLFGCEEVERTIPLRNDEKPGQLSGVEVENIPGGAKLTYSLPESPDMLYVLAEYSIRDGVTLSKKASYYRNSITLEGFPDTDAYDVNLYVVSRGDKKSEPVTVQVNPLTPPVISIFRSIQMRPTFGGVNVQFENENEAKVQLTVVTPDSLGDMTIADIFYTSWKSGDFSVRGYDSIQRPFGVFIRDRWDNYSDTVFADITPFFEKRLDKSKFQAVHLQNDTYEAHTGFKSIPAIWDGLEVVVASAFQTKPGSGMPQWFTFDLGGKYRLSRFKLHSKRSPNLTATGTAYTAGDPQVFEIWGSNDPSPDGSWETWHLIEEFIDEPISGSIPVTMEDINFAVNEGKDYEFPALDEAFRYLRFKTKETWGGVDFIYIGELTFWGSED